MKKLFLFCIAICMVISMMACGAPGEGEANTLDGVLSEPVDGKATIYAVFAMQGTAPMQGQAREYEFTYDGELTVEMLAAALSDLSGLDFFVNGVDVQGGSVTVDWAADSTLIANLDDRTQKEDFHFFDADSMRWFMMDSLWYTVTQNMAVEEVYYTMDGGNELVFSELYPINAFGINQPYMGSGYYLNPTDDGAQQASFSLSEGTWFLNGDEGSNYLIIGESGDFSYCMSDGTVSANGQLSYSENMGDIDMNMTEEQTRFDTFYFIDDNTIYLSQMGEEFKKLFANIPVAMAENEVADFIQTEVNHNYNGGYYYSAMSDDGKIGVVTTGYKSSYMPPPEAGAVLPPLDVEKMNAHILENVEILAGGQVENLTITMQGGHSINSPVFLLAWDSGPLHWDALFFDTYHHTYIYAFNSDYDTAKAMKELYLKEFDSVVFL